MTAREMLESYGALLSRDAALIRERKACLSHARNGPENAEHWIRRAKSLQAERNRVQRQLSRRLKELRLMLATLEDPALGELLALRYLSLMSYEDISEEMGFSLRHIYRLHLRAVALLEEGRRAAAQNSALSPEERV